MVHRSHTHLQRGLFHIDHIGLRGPILRAISCASGTLIDGKSVGRAECHHLHPGQSFDLIASGLPDELAIGQRLAKPRIAAFFSYSLRAIYSGAKQGQKYGQMHVQNRIRNDGHEIAF
jgi:hypothetical protein